MNPKKSLGQNFLIDPNIIRKIINLSKITNQNIVEIGPGTGNLTEEILKNNPKTLIIIEKDSHLCELLKVKFKLFKNLKIINKDILKFNLEKIIKKNSIIYGNLPYNIASQILVLLIKYKKWPPKYKSLVLMFQKEVGERFLAKPNDKNYGRLKVLSTFRLKIQNHFNISHNCFFPKPKIDSMVLLFKPVISKKFKIKKIENLEKLTHLFFSNKRKMINKAFKKLFKNNAENNAKKIKINLSYRPSQITEDEYFRLVELFEML